MQVVIEGKLDQSGNCSFAQCQDYDSDYVEYENVLPLVGIDELQIRTIYDDCKVNTSGNSFFIKFFRLIFLSC